MFLRILHNADDMAANTRMEREIRFDSDLWLVELEDIADATEFFRISVDE